MDDLRESRVDLLQLSNLVLIIGLYIYDLAEPICKAVEIINENVKTERAPHVGFPLFRKLPIRVE